MFYKSIIQGRLDFGTAKSFEKVLKMYEYRVENYHKNEILFKAEDIFFEETTSMDIPRFVGNIMEKSYKGTVDLLEYCVQFAVNGSVRAWLIDNGEVMHYHLMEPKSDKAAVQSYLKGKQYVKVAGKQEKAIEELSKAIEKYDKHAQAYERRGKTCFMMKKYTDAMRDYNKCISIDPTIPHAYYGRARVHLLNEAWNEAIEDLDHTIKKSVALEAIHWKARRLKGHAHFMIGEFDKAIFELKLYTSRKFKPDDSNNDWKRWGFYYYGLSLMEKENYIEAIAAFDEAEKFSERNDGIKKIDIIRNKGISKIKGGKNGGIKDLKEAIALGDKAAEIFLKNRK